ncbi:MAG: hypothetical protein AAF512_08150 [Pseudomonadota bacterium]
MNHLRRFFSATFLVIKAVACLVVIMMLTSWVWFWWSSTDIRSSADETARQFKIGANPLKIKLPDNIRVLISITDDSYEQRCGWFTFDAGKIRIAEINDVDVRRQLSFHQGIDLRKYAEDFELCHTIHISLTNHYFSRKVSVRFENEKVIQVEKSDRWS